MAIDIYKKAVDDAQKQVGFLNAYTVMLPKSLDLGAQVSTFRSQTFLAWGRGGGLGQISQGG